MAPVGHAGLLAVHDSAVGALHEALLYCLTRWVSLDHDRLVLAALPGVEVVADVDGQLATHLLAEVVAEQSHNLPNQVLGPLVGQGEDQVVRFARHMHDQELGKKKTSMKQLFSCV